MALFKRYFELIPINNINSFSPDNGVDIINFIIPPVAGAALPTDELILTGKLEVDTATNVPYYSNVAPSVTSAGTQLVGIDNVAGIDGVVMKVDVTSRNGNVLIEQRQNASLIAKWKKGVLSNEDLRVGRQNNQLICGNRVLNCTQQLTRNQAGEGTPFSFRIPCGFFRDATSMINLNAVGGVEVKIQLNSTAQFLMNVDNNFGAQLGADATYRLTDVKLFGRYQFMNPNSLARLNGVEFKQITNTMNTIQSSNETLALAPQVNSLDKIVYIYQPNADTRNNRETNGVSCNQLVGLDNYRVSFNGVLLPYDFPIENKTALGDLPASSGEKDRRPGDAEQCYHFITAMNGNYPPIHSLANCVNVTRGNADLYGVLTQGTAKTKQTNYFGNNVDGVAVSYQYGFRGYSVPMLNDMTQLQVVSQVKTSNTIVPAAVRDQVQTQNAFVVFNTELSYANLQVTK